ncbi:MAG: hypothetical protein H6831_12255 [Planctomycetes bacterium]|nr:hypothetical protein [Planctomycetota bacterium]MCB9905173.1 hypothetical protein [Planctomycetota bacterium]
MSFQPGGAIAAADGPIDPTDTDGDGLSDDFEWVLRSSPVLADTDGDGYSDLEEFARGSSVFWAASVPLPGEFSTRMTARQGDGYVHVLMATYTLDGNFTDFVQSLGLLNANDDLVLFPPAYVAAHGTMSTVTAADGSAVRLFELPIRDNLVHGAGGMTVFGTVARASTGTVIAADVVDLQSDAAHIFLRTQIKNRPSQRADLATSAGSQGGSVYVPLPLPGQIPSTWSIGQICKQVTTVVGVADGVVTREVVSSGCVEAFDSYCKSDCTMAVGTVEKSVDPLSLIGG